MCVYAPKFRAPLGARNGPQSPPPPNPRNIPDAVVRVRTDSGYLFIYCTFTIDCPVSPTVQCPPTPLSGNYPSTGNNTRRHAHASTAAMYLYAHYFWNRIGRNRPSERSADALAHATPEKPTAHTNPTPLSGIINMNLDGRHCTPANSSISALSGDTSRWQTRLMDNGVNPELALCAP